MADIDDKGVAALGIFSRWNEEASFLDLLSAAAFAHPANCSKAFDEAWLLVRIDGGYDDPIKPMGRLEQLLIALQGLT